MFIPNIWKIIQMFHIAKIIENTVILQNSLEHVVQTNAAMILQELYGTNKCCHDFTRTVRTMYIILKRHQCHVF